MLVIVKDRMRWVCTVERLGVYVDVEEVGMRA
jgi:hypothetical protein